RLAAHEPTGATLLASPLDALDYICRWLPLKADRSLPGTLLQTMERCGWTRHTTVPAFLPERRRPPPRRPRTRRRTRPAPRSWCGRRACGIPGASPSTHGRGASASYSLSSPVPHAALCDAEQVTPWTLAGSRPAARVQAAALASPPLVGTPRAGPAWGHATSEAAPVQSPRFPPQPPARSVAAGASAQAAAPADPATPAAAAPAAPAVPPPPPRFCAAHANSSCRAKAAWPSALRCGRCKVQVTTTYSTFALCAACSEAARRCMICGGPAPLSGNYVPCAALATARRAPAVLRVARVGGACSTQGFGNIFGTIFSSGARRHGMQGTCAALSVEWQPKPAITLWDLGREGSRRVDTVVGDGARGGQHARAALADFETMQVLITTQDHRLELWDLRKLGAAAATSEPGVVADPSGTLNARQLGRSCGRALCSGRAGVVNIVDVRGAGSSLKFGEEAPSSLM
ncbi:unnamed protein product, partial [Prorocentrum cordatum]